MAFNEILKREVRRKAAFACCICRKITPSVEIHHIIPQEDGGPNVIENAAPLCPTCHEDFGGNDEKRSRIKEMRDVWYETVEIMYGSKDFAVAEIIGEQVANIEANLPKIKDELKEYLGIKINEMTPQNAVTAISSIMSSAVSVSAQTATTQPMRTLIFRNGAYWEEGDSEPFCSRCWEVDQRAVHMHPMGNPAFYQCHNCKSGSVKARPDRDDPPRAHVYTPTSYR